MGSLDAWNRLMTFAVTQHGAIARWQLADADIPVYLVENRLRQGLLEIRHRGIYTVKALTGPRTRIMSAVLTHGPHAFLSHALAGALQALLPHDRYPITVSVARGHVRPRRGIRMFRVALPTDETMRWDGIPATTPPRTLLDNAATAKPRELEHAVARALRNGTTETDIRTVLGRYPRRPGASALAAVLDSDVPPLLVRSPAESEFLGLVRTARLPRPETNVRIAGHEVDALWRAERLVVEVDGLDYHAGRPAMIRDRRRDADLTAAGFRVIRVTWADIRSQPTAMLVRIAAALARRSELS